MSFSKFFNPKSFFSWRSIPRFSSSKNVFFFSNRVLFSSMVISVSLMSTFKQYFNKNTESSNPATSIAPEEPKKIEWEHFSESLYEECLKQRHEVIFILNIDDYKESFREELEASLMRISHLKQYFSKKKLRFLKLSFKTPEEKKAFEEKHHSKITQNTIFLIKNRYNESLIPFTISDYFSKKDYLLMIFAKLRKLSSKNQTEFSQYLKNSTNETVVVLVYNPKDSPFYESIKKKYSKLATDQRFLGQTNISFLMIKEDQIYKDLKIADPQIGDLFMMQKSSKLNYNKWNYELENHLQFQVFKATNLQQINAIPEIVERMIITSQKSNVFGMKGFESTGSDYSFNLEIDLNKLDEQDLKQLYNVIAEVKIELQKKFPNLEETISFNRIPKFLKKQGLRVSIRNEQKLFKHIMEREAKTMKDLETLYTNEKVPDINEAMSFTYIFEKNQDFTKANLIKFIEGVLEKKVSPNFESQKPPKLRAFSRKVVGKTFKKDIIENDKNQVLFIYSKHCYACKRFGQYYENLALESLKAGRKDIEFNRMNSDHNEVDCMRRFNYTPVFLVFKAGNKKNPCIYLSEKMTPELLQAFVENSVNYQVMSEEQVKKSYEELKRN